MDEKILKKIRLNTNKQKNTVILIGNKTIHFNVQKKIRVKCRFEKKLLHRNKCHRLTKK